MRIIGIDPGKTIGMVLYDSDARKVIDATEMKGETALLGIRDFAHDWIHMDKVTAVAVEWPRIYSKAGNEVADTCIQTGMIWWMLGARGMPFESGNWIYQKGVYLHSITRQQVVKTLSETMGQAVRTDAGVWAAMLELHGGKGVADRRATKTIAGGPLALLSGKPHAKAALAVAWAVSKSVSEKLTRESVSDSMSAGGR